VGRIGGVVFPDGGRFDHQAGDIQLQQGGQVFVGHVLQEDIVGQGHNTAQVKFIAHTYDCPGIRIGPVLGDLVPGPEGLHQQRGRDIRVHAPLVEVALEIAAPGGGEIVDGIVKGPLLGHREMVDVLDAQFPAFVHQAEQVIVGVVGGGDNVVVENQVVTGPVADQDVAVPVQNITTGRFNTGQSGKNFGIVGVAFCFNDLQIEESCAEYDKNQQKKQQKQPCANAAYSFHVSPPILLISFTRGYRGNAAAQVKTATRVKTPARSQMVLPTKIPNRKFSIS